MASSRPQQPFRLKNRRRRGRPAYASLETRSNKATSGKKRWHLRKVRGIPSESCGFEKRRFCRDDKGRFKRGMKGCALKYENVAVCRGIWGRFEGLDGLEAADEWEDHFDADGTWHTRPFPWGPTLVAGVAIYTLFQLQSPEF